VASHTVIDALRRFLPRFLATKPVLSAAQWRAVNAITQCRTPAMGGHVHACPECEGQKLFAWHSCNHKACPQCGRAATALWVARQLEKLAGAPYFLVTFTLPQELREMFFGPMAKEAFDVFFAAVALALAQSLALPKSIGACVTGFTAVLHTWTQQLAFHPHLHCIVPGAGLDANGWLRRVKSPDFLVHLPILQAAFRQAFRDELAKREWQVDPAVWTKDWGVDIRPCGDGSNAVKYLGAYVARTAIADSRILEVGQDHVTFLWKDRDHGNLMRPLKLEGVEFVRRYLRHVLPPKMHSVRHYGFCHPAAKKNRERVRFLTGMPLVIQSLQTSAAVPSKPWACPCCKAPMLLIGSLPRRRRSEPQERPPPAPS
jgi:hypothetical protein